MTHYAIICTYPEYTDNRAKALEGRDQAVAELTSQLRESGSALQAMMADDLEAQVLPEPLTAQEFNDLYGDGVIVRYGEIGGMSRAEIAQHHSVHTAKVRLLVESDLMERLEAQNGTA